MKKLLTLLLVAVIALSLLASCTFDFGALTGGGTTDGEGNGTEGGENGGGNGGANTGAEDENVENLIYNSTSELTVVVGDGTDSAFALNVADSVFNIRSYIAKVADDTVEKSEHEIVIGNSTREITELAKRRMNRDAEMKLDEDELYYAIYSDGSSVAIVFEEDSENIAQKLAIEYFIENYLDVRVLALPAGYVEVKHFHLIDDYYAKNDAETKAALWAAAEEVVGKETVQAMQSLASLYDFNLISWIANLYDPCICVCKGLGEEECQNTRYCKAQGGGFYFSNSARDTIGFLPDLESTRQAMDMLNMSGMTLEYGGNYYSGAVPQEMLQAIGRYTQVLQCSDGYFRHPQWADVADFDMRLNRDLSWAMILLNAANMSPFYTTPTGVQGIGVPPELASSALTNNLNSSVVSAVSKVVATSETYPAILESLETFQADLDAHQAALKTSSYGTGSRYSTYLAQMDARDKVIGTPDNPRPLMTAYYNWLEENKNPERGTWVGDESWGGNPKQIGAYAETNGVMKIIGCYSYIRMPYTYGLEAMQACIDVLTTDENPTGTVDIYNAWIALNGVYSAVKNYNSSYEAEAAERLMQDFRSNATDAVLASRDKIALFKRADGSFSYSQKGGDGYSMGMHTQVVGTSEGDVNGALIASADCWRYICSSLGFSNVPIFGSAEMYKFRKIIEDAESVKKQGVNMDYTTLDFEYDDVGDEPVGGLTLSKNSEGTTFTVQSDSANNNNYLQFVSTPVSASNLAGNSVKVLCESLVTSASAFVFEADICLAESAYKDAAFQIQLGDINYFIRAMVEGEKLKLVEKSSDVNAHTIDMELDADIDLGDWFRIKIVYYPGDHDTVRIKVYFANLTDGDTDLRLLAVSDNYWDQYGNKNSGNGNPKTAYAGTTVYALKSFDGTILLDNLSAYKTKDAYVPESDPNNQPPHNVDPPEAPQKVYSFDDGVIDTDIGVTGSPTVVGGELVIVSSTTLTVPMNNTKNGGRCASYSFDLNCASADVGDLFDVTLSEPTGKVFTLVFTVKEDEDGKYITCYERAEGYGATISTVKIPLAEKTNIRVDYHHNEDVAIIYVGGEFIAVSSYIYNYANKRTAKELAITTLSNNYRMSVDNLIFERNLNSYDEAAEPSKNSVIHNFEDGLGDATLSGSAKLELRSTGGSQSNVIELTQPKGALTVPVNNRSNITSVLTFNADLYFSELPTSGETHTVKFIDNEGYTIFAIALKISGSKLEIYEVGHDGTLNTRIGATEKSGIIKLGIEVYRAERTAYVYSGTDCIAKTSVFASPERMNTAVTKAEIATSMAKSVLLVDNVKVESLYKLFEEISVTPSITNTDSTNPLTFENSNSGSLPSGFINTGKHFSVENVYNSVSGEYSNAGVLNTIKGINEKVGVTLDEANTQSCVIFETDFMFVNPEYEAITQIFLTEGGGVPFSCLYGIVFEKTEGDTFSIADYADGKRKTTLVTNLSLGTWYRLRLEFYVIAATGESRIKVFINDELEYITDNHYRLGQAATNNVKEAFFYTFLDSKCSIYVDNMSLTTSDATCNESVGAK